MKTFTYPILARFIYRYANIPATLLLALHFVSLAIGIAYEWYMIFPAAVNALIIYLLNRFYFRSYGLFPFRIEADNERIICSNYLFSGKVIDIKLAEIKDIQGGIFGKNVTRPVYIYFGDDKDRVGLHNHLKEFDKLMTIVLSNIDQKLYDELLKRIKENRKEGGRKIKK